MRCYNSVFICTCTRVIYINLAAQGPFSGFLLLKQVTIIFLSEKAADTDGAGLAAGTSVHPSAHTDFDPGET